VETGSGRLNVASEHAGTPAMFPTGRGSARRRVDIRGYDVECERGLPDVAWLAAEFLEMRRGSDRAYLLVLSVRSE